MFQFKNKVIKMTRGDSGRLKVDLKSSSGAPYVMREGDTLTLTVRKSVHLIYILRYCRRGSP